VASGNGVGLAATSLLDQLHARWQPLAVGLLAAIVLNGAAYFGFIRAYVKTSGDAEAIVASEQERLARIQSDVTGLERLTSKLACTRSDVERVFDETLSSKEKRLTAIQRELRLLAKERNLDPDLISYSAATVRQTDLVKLSIAFPLEGPYETLEGFIASVEESKNFLIVEDVSMQESQGKTLRLAISLVTYFQAPRMEIPPPVATDDTGAAAAVPGAGA